MMTARHMKPTLWGRCSPPYVQAAIQLVSGQVAKNRFLTGPDYTIADTAVDIELNRARGWDFVITLPTSLFDCHVMQKADPGLSYANQGEVGKPGHQQAAE